VAKREASRETRASDAAPSAPATGPGESAVRAFSAERPLLARRYEILGLIGSGGMGIVYRARDLELDEIVALKVLRPEIADAPGVVERFRREAKLARRVTDASVARVFDIGEDAGERFLTMELIEGESLAALLAREGALAPARAVAIAIAIAAGLVSAHAAGVVHRDLKPENVLLGRDGRVAVTDFGIASAIQDAGRTTFAGEASGTPAYMAPEQVTGRPVIDARADIYAFGALLYELCTGAQAWSGPSAVAIASARLFAPPPDPRARVPHLPDALAKLIVHCLARRPEGRPASMADVAAELGALTSLPSSTAARPSPTTTLPATPDERPSSKVVAVLPFRNGGPPEDDYLAEELTDDLIDALSMTGNVKVRARGVVARYRGGDLDPREVGRALAVQVVVEGTVRRARGSVRVSARIISVADGLQLWAKRIERPDEDVLSINDDVAQAVGDALTAPGSAAPREAPHSAAAIDLYLRGRHEYRKFWPDHLRRSIGIFAQAAALAPDDAMILSATAMAHARLAFFAGTDGLAEARRAAERAVAVGPNMGEARLALGAVLLQLGEGKGALTAMRQAVARSPGLAEAHAALGRLLVELGAVDEGVRRLTAALDLDPHVPLAVSALLRTHALLGDWQRSDAMVERLREAEGSYSYWTVRTRLALWRRQPLEGVDLSDRPGGAVLALPAAMVEVLRTGQWPAAIPTVAEVRALPDIGNRRRIMYYQMYAEMAGNLRDHALLLSVLRCAADDGLLDALWLDRCPLFVELRGDARFDAIHAEVMARAATVLDASR
jgi:serine/threonine-protein kinase